MEHSNVLEGETFKPEKKRNSSLPPKKKVLKRVLRTSRDPDVLLPVHLVGMIFFVLQIFKGHGGDVEKRLGASLEP